LTGESKIDSIPQRSNNPQPKKHSRVVLIPSERAGY